MSHTPLISAAQSHHLRLVCANIARLVQRRRWELLHKQTPSFNLRTWHCCCQESSFQSTLVTALGSVFYLIHRCDICVSTECGLTAESGSVPFQFYHLITCHFLGTAALPFVERSAFYTRQVYSSPFSSPEGLLFLSLGLLMPLN